MKKNIMTVIIMAAVMINLILTIVVVFSVVPAMNKSNKLVEKIASIIDLEIDAENSEGEKTQYQDLETIALPYDAKQTIILKRTAGDDKTHYAMIESVTVSLNKNADDYKDIKSSIETSGVYIQEKVKEVIGEFEFKNISDKAIREESLKRIQEFYNSKAIVKVESLGGFVPS